MIYIIFFSLGIKIIIHLAQKAQIAPKSVKNISKSISAKHLDFPNIFSKKWAIKLLEYLSINKYAYNEVSMWFSELIESLNSCT